MIGKQCNQKLEISAKKSKIIRVVNTKKSRMRAHIHIKSVLNF